MWWAGRAACTEVWLGRSFAGLSVPGLVEPGLSQQGFATAEQSAVWLEQAMASRQASKRWAVMLGSGLARPFVFKPPQGLKTHLELRAIAASLAADETGLTDDTQLWVSGPDEAGDRLAVVADAAALMRIEAAAKRAGARLVSVRPGWVVLTNGPSLPEVSGSDEVARLLFASDPDGVTAVAGTRQRWLWAGAVDRPVADADAVAWRTRVALRLQAEARAFEFALDGLAWVPRSARSVA